MTSNNMLPGEGAALQAALSYHSQGLSLIPVDRQTKRPPKGFRWKRYQEEPPTTRSIRGWWKRDPDLSVGIVCGPGSGGLACRDFDDLGAYEEWASNHRQLADTLPTVATSRGRHVYFRPKKVLDTGVVKVGDGELRVSRCYNVAPPSIHPSGFLYDWLIPLTADVSILDPRRAGLLPKALKEDKGRGRTSKILPSHPPTLPPVSNFLGAPGSLDELIIGTLPERTGQRHDCIFDLARMLKALPEYRDAPVSAVLPIFDRWLNLAWPVIGTQSVEYNRKEFRDAWRETVYRAGAGAIRPLMEMVRGLPLPPEAERYRKSEARLLVTLCRELQRWWGERPFFLGCRLAGELLGMPRATAAYWLNRLCADELLLAVDGGSYRKRRAAQFHYLGSMDDPRLDAVRIIG